MKLVGREKVEKEKEKVKHTKNNQGFKERKNKETKG
jgi:hypothetical protein